MNGYHCENCWEPYSIAEYEDLCEAGKDCSECGIGVIAWQEDEEE